MSAVYADPATLWERALTKVEHVGDCWVFRGALQTQGYASISAGKAGRTILGHRLAVLVRDGELPNLPIDHTCRVRACINPAHLEVVTTAENNKRMREAYGYVIGGLCGSGHVLTEENVYRHPRGQLACRACTREVSRNHRDRAALRNGHVPASAIREWALSVGLPVAARGRLSPTLRRAYDAAHLEVAA